MFLVMEAIQSNEKWPKDLPISNQYSNDKEGLMQQYKDQLTQQKETVVDFVKQIRSLTYNLPAELNCGDNEFCKQFVAITELDEEDYFLYKGYIESILDSVIAVKPNNGNALFGYSLAIRNNIPQEKDAYNFIQKVSYASEPMNAQYTALLIAGLDAYFAIFDREQKVFIGITRNMGNSTDYPEYDDQQQSEDVNKFASETISQVLFNYYYNAEQQSLDQYMNDYQTQQVDEIISIYSEQYKLFKSVNVDNSYERQTSEEYFEVEGDSYTTTSFVQTFQQAFIGDVIESDYRIVQMERSLKSLSDEASLSSWWSALNVYPMRTQTTPTMVAFSQNDESEKLYLTKCQSVYDAQGNTAACLNPPVPCNIASVVCSILIIIGTIAIWIYGCIKAKQFDALQDQMK